MAIVFAESGVLAGFCLPGDFLLFSAGVLLADGAIYLPFTVVALGLAVAAFLGDRVGYLVGRTAGPRLFDRDDSRLFSRQNAARAHDFFRRHGPKAVFLARFVPVVRGGTCGGHHPGRGRTVVGTRGAVSIGPPTPRPGRGTQ